MKTCVEMKGLINLYHLKELTAIDAQYVEEHILHCASCNEEFSKTRDFLAGLSCLKVKAPPQALLNNLNAKIHSRLEGRFFIPFRFEFLRTIFAQPVLLPTAIVLLVVVAIFIAEGTRTGDDEANVAVLEEMYKESDTVLAETTDTLGEAAEVMDRVMLAQAEDEAETEGIFSDLAIFQELGESPANGETSADDLEDLEYLNIEFTA